MTRAGRSTFPFPSIEGLRGRLGDEVARRVRPDRGNFWRMACWNEAAALGLMDLADALRADERLPAEVREFVIMRTAFRCGASLPVAHHSAAARSLAVPEWLIEAAIGRAQLPLDDGFGDVAAVVDSLVADKQAEPEAFERLQARLGPALALDIVMLTGLYITVSLVMNACAITCEDKD